MSWKWSVSAVVLLGLLGCGPDDSPAKEFINGPYDLSATVTHYPDQRTLVTVGKEPVGLFFEYRTRPTVEWKDTGGKTATLIIRSEPGSSKRMSTKAFESGGVDIRVETP